MALEGQQWLKSFEGLQRPLETDSSWLNAMSISGLGHDCTDEVVCQDVSPDFFANKLRCFASQEVHLESYFDVSDIQLLVPSTAI